VLPDQFPTLFRLMQDVRATLDWPTEVPVFVSQAAWFNAGTYGVDKPFIVVNSAALDLLEPEELRVVLAHELGHVMSGHALYRTMLALILAIGMRQVPLLAGLALMPIRFGLQEWGRKSELSADRAGLLAAQDLRAAVSMFLKAAGGTLKAQSELNVEAYERQIAEYEESEGLDPVFKFLNLIDRTHPFHTLRAAELRRWSRSPEYAAILNGEYRRRSDPSARYGEDLNAAANYYAGEALERVKEVTTVAKNIAQEGSQFARRTVTDASEVAHRAREATFDRFNHWMRNRK